MLTNPERLRDSERAIIVGLHRSSDSTNAVDDHLDELEKLIAAAGGEALARVVQERSSPDPATYIGKGKAEEVAHLARSLEASLVVFDDDLTPGQIRNLEKAIPVKVIDRSTLILDIFAGRARTREAKTQVELAQLQYLLPRLTRQWSHLSRQAGGIGTRGVGETQLEIDRRLVRNRISRLRQDLDKIERTRKTQREGRHGTFTVALVGYTNAGKSTLFNRLTGDDTYAANKLFATLDSRLRKAGFETPRETVLIDTVGFVRKLPHHLVASFRSTMEEAVSADLVLHVVDFSHPQHDDQEAVGGEVLDDLQIDRDRVITVYNKIDRVEHDARNDTPGSRAWVSALTGEGIERLEELIRRREAWGGETVELCLPPTESRLLAQLYELGNVQRREERDEGTLVTAWVPDEVKHLFAPFLRPSG